MADQSIWPFEALPKEIKEWLTSPDVAAIIERINARHALTGGDEYAVPFVTTWLAIKSIQPEETIGELIEGFGLEPQTAIAVATEIKQKILMPIKFGLKNVVGIDIEKVTAVPRAAPEARVMNMEKPINQAPRLQQPTPASSRPPTTPAIPKARVMEFKPRTTSDIKKPLPRQALAGPGTAPSAPVQTARVVPMEKVSGSQPVASKAAAPKPVPATAPQQPVAGPDVLESERPFGLAEVIPEPEGPPVSPSQGGHEVEKYEDRHPTAE